MKEQDDAPEKQLSGNGQSTGERIQNNDSKDHPRFQENNGCKDWRCKKCLTKTLKTEEQTEMNNTITEMKNTLQGINSRESKAEKNGYVTWKTEQQKSLLRKE